MARVEAEVSLTETRQFRRLVEFAESVADHAALVGDDILMTECERLAQDLMEMTL